MDSQAKPKTIVVPVGVSAQGYRGICPKCKAGEVETVKEEGGVFTNKCQSESCGHEYTDNAKFPMVIITPDELNQQVYAALSAATPTEQ